MTLILGFPSNRYITQLIALVSILVLLSSGYATARPLTQLSSNAGEIRDLLQAGSNTLFAATQGGGIYKSTDGGSSWTKLSGFGERYVWRLAGHTANNQLIYAATSKGLFKSSDGGTSWTQLTFDNVRALAIDPYDSNHILIGVPGTGIFSSFDGGAAFSLAKSGLDSLEVTAIAFDPVNHDVVYAGLNSNLSSAWGGVFKSTDRGITWTDWNNPNGNGALGNKFVTGLVVDSQGSVHAGTYHPGTYSGGLYKQSGNGGWTLRQEVYGVETIVMDKNTSSRLWAGTRSFGPWISNNYGSNWSQAVNPSKAPEVYSTIYSLLTFPGSPDKVLAGVKGLGLYQTLNSGASWDLTGAGLKADRAKAIAAYPSASPTRFYLGLVGGGVMKSIDVGTTWSDFNDGLEVPSVENNLTVPKLGISTTDPNNIYAATHGRGFFRWNGTQWVRVNESGLPNNPETFLKPQGLVVDTMDDRVVHYSLFDSNQGVYRRDTGGAWSLVLSGPFSGAGASRIVMSPTNHLKRYALMFDDLPYLSTDGGNSWTKVNAIHSGFMRLSFYALAENPLDANMVLANTNKGLFKSTDGGNSWTSINPVSGLNNTILTGLAFSHAVNRKVWAVDLSGNYYCSDDAGANWVTLADPLLGCAIVDLQWIAGALYLVTDGCGVLKDPSPICP
jgi:photosystem II stability/assembly factor-like uncharacterized protein